MNARPHSHWMVLVLGIWTAPALAADVPWYGAVHAGRNRIDSWPLTVDTGSSDLAGTLLLEDGLHTGLAAGRQFGAARAELELQYGRLRAPGARLGSASRTLDASAHYTTVMLNAYAGSTLAGPLRGYAAVGAGLARVALPGAWFSATCQCLPAARDHGAAYQGRLGAELVLAPAQFLDLQWTRLRLPALDDGTASRSVHYGARWVGAIALGYRRQF